MFRACRRRNGRVRPRRLVRILLFATLLLVGTVAVTGAATATSNDVELVEVVPNPVAYGDAGERLVFEFSTPTNVSGWTVADGETVVRFPNRTLSGRVVATTDPGAIPSPESSTTIVQLVGRLALANAGETIEVRSRSAVVTTVSYEDAPEGQHYVRSADGWTWHIPGTTDSPIVTAHDVPARLFVLPDDPSVPLTAIEGASDRVLLAAYTFASERIEGALCSATDRGVRVEVLLEAQPIGGVERRQAQVLDRLVACDVDVSVIGGPGGRYAVHHPKYAVVDDRALVLSENWKPAGTGGRSSRGWGVFLDSPGIADALAQTFRADADFSDVRPWSQARDGLELTTASVANGTFPARFQARDVVVDRVDLLVAPDNAESGLVELIDSADGEVAVQQVRIGGLDGPFANATVRAARRGVPVQVLLSGAWYVREDNGRLVEELEAIGRTEGIPVQARLVQPRSRFEKTHTKGLIVDGRAAAVGSLNWNAYAARNNREVVVVLRDSDAATYYGRVFEADWRGGTWRLPLGYAIAVALFSLSAALLLNRSIEFDEPASATDSVPAFDQSFS